MNKHIISVYQFDDCYMNILSPFSSLRIPIFCLSHSAPSLPNVHPSSKVYVLPTYCPISDLFIIYTSTHMYINIRECVRQPVRIDASCRNACRTSSQTNHNLFAAFTKKPYHFTFKRSHSSVAWFLERYTAIDKYNSNRQNDPTLISSCVLAFSIHRVQKAVGFCVCVWFGLLRQNVITFIYWV